MMLVPSNDAQMLCNDAQVICQVNDACTSSCFRGVKIDRNTDRIALYILDECASGELFFKIKMLPEFKL